MSPSACSLDPIAAPSRHRGAASRIDHNAVTMIERRSQTGITVAARHHFRVWPDLKTDLLERTAVFLNRATGQENSRAIDLLRKLCKNRAQTLGRGEPKIGRRQFSLVKDGPVRAGVKIPGYSFNEHPGGFRSA